MNRGGEETPLNSEKTSVAFVYPPYGAPNLANPDLTILARGLAPQLSMPSSLDVPWEFPYFERDAQLGGKGGALRAQLGRLGKLSVISVKIAIVVARARYFPSSLSKRIERSPSPTG